jgi:O-succinylbenzoic acid--CoA ligase
MSRRCRGRLWFIRPGYHDVNLGLALRSRVARTPTAVAIESRGRSWTFAELADCARRGATHLLAACSSSDGPIAILMAGDERFVAWFHAVVLTGRIVLPLNARLTAGELAQQLVDAGVRYLLCERGDDRLPSIQSKVPGLVAAEAPDFDLLPQATDCRPGEVRNGDAAFAVLFTSGTSGRSKGACLSWTNFEASAAAALDRLGPAVGKRWLSCMPLFHVGGLSILVRSTLYGGPVRLLPRFEVAEVSEALDASDVAGVSLVPTMLSRLLEHRAGRPAPSSLEVLLLGGAAATSELLARAHKSGYPVCVTYGLTEATSQVATARPWRAGAAFRPPVLPLPGTEVRIVHTDQDAASGQVGEIAVRGPTVMTGYLGNPEATAYAIRDGWLHTGDLGFLDAEGGLHVLDRRDDLIVSGGENVYPAEVEAILLEHASVADAGVAGLPDADLGARVVAWIVVRDGAAGDAAVLSKHCHARLAGFKRPREYRFVGALPRTAVGKLQRRRLAAQAGGA